MNLSGFLQENIAFAVTGHTYNLSLQDVKNLIIGKKNATCSIISSEINFISPFCLHLVLRAGPFISISRLMGGPS